MSVDSSDDIRSSLMNGAMDLESSGINSMHISSLTDFAFLIYKNEVRDFHMFERFEERVDPEMVVFNWVPDRDMACSSFIAVTVCSHPSEGLSIRIHGIKERYSCHVFLAVLSFFFEGGESRA